MSETEEKLASTESRAPFRKPKDLLLDIYPSYAAWGRELGIRPDVISNYFAGRMEYVTRVNRIVIRAELERLGIVKSYRRPTKVRVGKRRCAQ